MSFTGGGPALRRKVALMRFAKWMVFALSGMTLAACATVTNIPINVPTADSQAGLTDQARATTASEDDLLVGLAFAGGGTRAAAFSFGVLQGLAATASGSTPRTSTTARHSYSARPPSA